MKKLFLLLLMVLPLQAFAETNALKWVNPTGRCETTAPLINQVKTVIYRAATKAALPTASPAGEPCTADPVDYAPFESLKIAEVPFPATTYSDTTAPAGVVYYVAVAVDADGVPSNPSTVATSSRPMPPVSISVQ